MKKTIVLLIVVMIQLVATAARLSNSLVPLPFLDHILNTHSFSGFSLFLFPFLCVKILNRSYGYAWKFCLNKEKNKIVKIPENLNLLSIN